MICQIIECTRSDINYIKLEVRSLSNPCTIAVCCVFKIYSVDI